MLKKILIFSAFIISLLLIFSFASFNHIGEVKKVKIASASESHWFELHRKSGIEYLYFGISGDLENSKLVREFQVRAGTENETPTPLPQLVGKEYWIVVKKEISDNPETAPYFLTLDIPFGDDAPYGPVPYIECLDPDTNEKIQCDWQLPGYFGLHGINGNKSKLTDKETGSYGCVRHEDLRASFIDKNIGLAIVDEEILRPKAAGNRQVPYTFYNSRDTKPADFVATAARFTMETFRFRIEDGRLIRKILR